MYYIDMDGVVSDFDQAIINIFGEEYSDKIASVLWRETVIKEEVFRKMPPIKEGIDMVNRIKAKRDICFMTSTGGMPHHIDIAKQKLDWLHEHGLGEHPVAFCMSTEGKGKFAQEGRILIDDRQKVVDVWKRNGGNAYLFTRNGAETIADFILIGT